MTRMECLKELVRRAPGFAQKVAPIYKFLKWKWDNKVKGIPTEKDILKATLGLIIDMEITTTDYQVSSGGIAVGFHQIEDTNYYEPYIRFEVNYIGDQDED